MAHRVFSELILAGFGGAVLFLGAAFRWWAMLVPVCVAGFLVYAWEFSSEGAAYASIVCVAGCLAVAAGVLLRQALW